MRAYVVYTCMPSCSAVCMHSNVSLSISLSYELHQISVLVHVVGKCGDRVFEDRDVTFIIGEGDAAGVTAGLELVVRKSKLGSKSKAIVKSKYAYGSEGNAEYNIPPDADLEYEVDLKSFELVKTLF